MLVIEAAPDEPTMEEPMSDPIVEEPAFQPEPLTIYILDAADEIVIEELCTEANYGIRFRAFRLQCELWAQEGKQGGPFRAVGGGIPE